MTQATKKKQSLWSFMLSLLPLWDWPSFAPSSFSLPTLCIQCYGHTNIDCLAWMLSLSWHMDHELCRKYGGYKHNPFAASIISAGHCSINYRGSAKTWISCISAVHKAASCVITAAHCFPLFACATPIWGWPLYHIHNYVFPTCSSGTCISLK